MSTLLENPTVKYASLQGKQRRYVRETLPLVFHQALAAMPLHLGARNLDELHESIRAGEYVGEHGPKDEVRSVARTLSEGGDCEDWAAVQLAAAWSLGVPARIVTAGDGGDHFAHVYVEWFDRGRHAWVASNPKGSQYGMPYGRHSNWQVKRRWALDRHGRMYEVRSSSQGSTRNKRSRPVSGSGAAARGSGSESGNDPVIRNWRDAAMWLGDLWTDRFRQISLSRHNSAYHINLQEGGMIALAAPQLWQAHKSKLKSGRAALRLSTILAEIDRGIDALANKTLRDRARALFNRYTRPTLAEVNADEAAIWAVGTMQSGREGRDAMRQMAAQLGAKPDATDNDKAVVVAVAAAQQATGAGVEFDRMVEAYRELGDGAAPQQVLQLARQKMTTNVQGSGSILSEFIEDVGDFAGNVVREVGKGVRRFAKNILNADETVPWLSQFVLRPLGFMAQAKLIEQVGEMMVAGRADAFDGDAVVDEIGATMSSAGQVLVVASPFIPQPWGVAAAAVGALMVAGGQLIRQTVDPESTLNTGKLGQDQTVQLDRFGRQVGPDGLPVDPYQRQQELQRRQQHGPDPGDQVANDWRVGENGLVYGWHELGTDRFWWVALQLDQQQSIQAAWAWNDERWVQLA